MPVAEGHPRDPDTVTTAAEQRSRRIQFLVITKQATSPPPEMMGALFEVADAWMRQAHESGTLTHVWSFAGKPGGAGSRTSRVTKSLTS